jgi:AraC-like DNA-binding protein
VAPIPQEAEFFGIQFSLGSFMLELLARGVSAAKVVRQAGYADQPLLTRSLKRFAGQTPSQITRRTFGG